MKTSTEKKTHELTNINDSTSWKVWFPEYLTSIERKVSDYLQYWRRRHEATTNGDFDVQMTRMMRGGPITDRLRHQHKTISDS